MTFLFQFSSFLKKQSHIKYSLLFLFIVLLSFLFPLKSFAQTDNSQQPISNSDYVQIPTPQPSYNNTQIPNSSDVSYPLNTDPDVPQDFHTYTQTVFIELMSSISCQLSGIDPLNPNGKCLSADGNNGKIGFVQNGGALGFLQNNIAYTYQMPVSTGQYLADLDSGFGIVRTANAADTGSGYQSLVPFLPIWKVFRNISYLLFVVIFIVLGLGIMFRVNIDPRTTMTIQNTIPKIIIALILITFSYAIVGFLIDLMHVTMYLIYGVFSTIPNVNITDFTPAKVQGANPITAANHLADSNFGIASFATNVTGVIVPAIKDAIGINPKAPSLEGLPAINGVGSLFGNVITKIPGVSFITDILGKIPIIGGAISSIVHVGSTVTGDVLNTNFSIANYLIHAVSAGVGIFTGIQVAQWSTPDGGAGAEGLTFGGSFNFNPGLFVGIPLGATVGTIVAGFTEVILREVLPNLIVFFIVLIALLGAMFRLWFQLIKAYVYLFLYIILAPFFIAFGIIPGLGSGFGNWFRNVIANIAVFPVTYIMFLLGKVLIDSTAKSKGNVFVPPFIGDFSNSAGGFSAILGLGILLLTPEVVNMVRAALKAPDNKYTSSIGRAVGAGTGFVSSPVKNTFSKVTGEDARGNPRWLTRVANERGGRIAGAIFGGSFKSKAYDEDNHEIGKYRWFGRMIRKKPPTSKPEDEGGEKKREPEGSIVHPPIIDAPKDDHDTSGVDTAPKPPEHSDGPEDEPRSTDES